MDEQAGEPHEFTGSEAVVDELYRLLLGRGADDDGRRLYSGLIDTGRLDLLGVVRTLAESAEFHARVSPPPRPPETAPAAEEDGLRTVSAGPAANDGPVAQPPGDGAPLDPVAGLLSPHEAAQAEAPVGEELAASPVQRPEDMIRVPPLARHLVEILIPAVMGRRPSEHTLQAYAAALANGYPLGDFMNELTSSPEYTGQRTGKRVPSEVAQLLAGMITARMVADGCKLAVPPMQSAQEETCSMEQANSLIRTLAMMAQPMAAAGRA